jgi:hypothetical protein
MAFASSVMRFGFRCLVLAASRQTVSEIHRAVDLENLLHDSLPDAANQRRDRV